MIWPLSSLVRMREQKHALILGLLADSTERMRGMQLVERSGGKLGRGTIYVYLSDLEELGLVASERESIWTAPRLPGFTSQLRRREYWITDAGRAVLAGGCDDATSNTAAR